MPSSYTPRLNLPEMADGEQSGYVTYNELARILDAMLNSDCEDVTLTDPPGSPQEGQLWFIPFSGATGAWTGQEGKLAQWFNGSWHFYSPPVNTTFYDKATQQRIWIDPANQIIVPLTLNLGVLTGNPTNGTLNGILVLDGWDDKQELGVMEGALDPVTGTFTAPASYLGVSLYNIIIHVSGDQGNSTKEEDIRLEMVIAGGGSNAGTYEVTNLTVSTDKTSRRTLQASFSFSLEDGETMQWRLNSTANLGTFSFVGSTFQVRRVA